MTTLAQSESGMWHLTRESGHVHFTSWGWHPRNFVAFTSDGKTQRGWALTDVRHGRSAQSAITSASFAATSTSRRPRPSGSKPASTFPFERPGSAGASPRHRHEARASARLTSRVDRVRLALAELPPTRSARRTQALPHPNRGASLPRTTATLASAEDETEQRVCRGR